MFCRKMHIRGEFILSLPLLLNVLFLFDTSSVCAQTSFKLSECIDNDCDKIVSVTQEETTQNIYVTTQRSLKILAENLTLIKEVNTAGDNNVLTILRGSEILNCKNDNSGTCELRDSSSLAEISKEITGSDVTYPGSGPIVGWIDKGLDGGTVLTTALSTKDSVNVAQPLPLVSTRTFPSRGNSSSSNEGNLKLLTDDYSVPSSYLQPSPCLADDIEPFYGFTAGNYRYILKTHRPTEERGVTQVKLIRLCKNDQTYRSYMELPLECQGHNEGLTGQTEFVSSVAYYTNGVLYVTFTKKADQSIKTYICQYSIELITNRFNNRRRECLEGVTKTTEIHWHRLNYCPKAPPPQFNFSLLDDPDYCYSEPHAQPLGGNEAIVQTALAHPRVEATVVALLVVAPTYRGDTVYLLGDNSGSIRKVSSDGSNWEEDTPTSVPSDILKQYGLLLHRDEEHYYVVTETEIFKHPLYEPSPTEPPPTTVQPRKQTTRRTFNRPSTETNSGAKTRQCGFLVLAVVLSIKSFIWT